TMMYGWLGLVGSSSAPEEAKQELVSQALLAFKAGGADEKDDRLKWMVAHAGKRPKSETAWKAVLGAGKGDPAAGERVFFHPSGPRCYASHRLVARGPATGPPLSTPAP